jgi:hypothetical protein
MSANSRTCNRAGLGEKAGGLQQQLERESGEILEALRPELPPGTTRKEQQYYLNGLS